MRLLSKVMTGVSVAALAVLVAGGIDAQAASSGPSFNTDKTLAGIEAGNMVSFDAVKAKGETLTWNAKAKWDSYYASVDVDLSNLKTTKDAYITVKTSGKSGDAYTVYKVAKDTAKKYKGSITGAGALEILVDGKKVEADKLADFEYRTVNSSWKAITVDRSGVADFSVAPYEQQGATLYFRYKGKEISPEEATADIKDAPEGVTLSTIATDSFVGKEFKVKVSKMANAPAITVDYKNGVVKFKNKTEYRVGSFTDLEGWADFTANYAVDPSEASTFQMRTKATDKKPASKIAVYNWKAVAAPTVTDVVDKNGDLNADTGNIIENELTYTAKEADTKAKAIFEIKNAMTGDTAKTIEIYKAKTEGSGKDAKVVADGKAIATLKAGKAVSLKDSKVADGTKLIVRYAGDKKTDVLPSAYSEDTVTVKYNVKAASEE